MKKFKEINRKKRMLLISGISAALLITIVLLYRSYAVYQESQNFNVIHGSVPEYLNNYDVRLTLTIDGAESNEFPSRDSGKVFERAECDKGAIGLWDYEIWGPKIANATKTRTKCKYHFVSRYSDSVLNGADPVLKDGLIPVTIDETGVVRKASLKSEWYNYADKKWANAVILEDESIQYQDNEEIPEDNIESYFVWIPRYKYKIFNDGNDTSLSKVENKVQTIEVEFENNTVTPSMGSGTGQWLTHPAFTSFDVNGMWVGKFETGYKNATSTNAAQSDTNDSGNVVIKPNVYSWRGIRVANAFTASYNYRRSMDSHMMKNTEWGAVAYLQHSAYGSQTSVRINNNSAYITGYAAKNEPTTGYTETNVAGNIYEKTALGVDGISTYNYKNNASVIASTTGTRNGVYDMSGGAWEYVMGVMADKNGNPASGHNDTHNSNFVGTLLAPWDGSDTSKTSWNLVDEGIRFPDSKYYDIYPYVSNEQHFNRRILGDATGEMGPFANATYGTQIRQINSWYNDEGSFVYYSPWFIRGGASFSGMGAGIFSFGHSRGREHESIGFRVVLSF